MKKIRNIFFPLFLLFTLPSAAQDLQPTWSLATDFSVLRSMKEQQRFWTWGHTIRGEMHLTKRTGPYVWMSYFFNGKFNNNLSAEAKSVSTSPQSIAFRSRTVMRLKEISLGWKHYLKGSSDNDASWNLYAMAGFGIIGGKVENRFSQPVDTSLYAAPLLSGTSRFKRLTLDLGAGWEMPLGGDLFLYNDVKLWIPASDYPSAYLVSNRYAPLIVSLHIGMRIYLE